MEIEKWYKVQFCYDMLLHLYFHYSKGGGQEIYVLMVGLVADIGWLYKPSSIFDFLYIDSDLK